MLPAMIVWCGVIVGASFGFILGSVVFEAEQKGYLLRAFCAAVFASLVCAVGMFGLGEVSLAYASCGLVAGVPVFFKARKYYVPWYFGIGQYSGYFGSPDLDRRDAKVDYCLAGVAFSIFAGYFSAQWALYTLDVGEAFIVTLCGATLGAIPALGAWYFLKLLLSSLLDVIGYYHNMLVRIAAALC